MWGATELERDKVYILVEGPGAQLPLLSFGALLAVTERSPAQGPAGVIKTHSIKEGMMDGQAAPVEPKGPVALAVVQRSY
jgi:hypothetical protein